MNFTTDLPKKDPIVSYIVASAVKCEKFFPGSQKEGPVFRMHAVILSKKALDKKANGGGNLSQDTIETGLPKYPNLRNQKSKKWAPAQNAMSYILCHVRRVNEKSNDDEEEEIKLEELKLDKNSCNSGNYGFIENFEMIEETNKIKSQETPMSSLFKEQFIDAEQTKEAKENHLQYEDSSQQEIITRKNSSPTNKRRRTMTDGQENMYTDTELNKNNSEVLSLKIS